MEGRRNALKFVLHHTHGRKRSFPQKSDAIIAAGSGVLEHSMHSQNVVKPNWLVHSKGTSYPYVTSAHIDEVRNRFEGYDSDTGYRRRVAIATCDVRTLQDDGKYAITCLYSNVKL